MVPVGLIGPIGPMRDALAHLLPLLRHRVVSEPCEHFLHSPRCGFPVPPDVRWGDHRETATQRRYSRIPVMSPLPNERVSEKPRLSFFDGEMTELPVCLPTWQAAALERAAHARG